MSPLEPPYRLIREGLLRGEVIPFLGAGASGGNPSVNWEKGRSDCPPTTAQLSGLLASAANFPVGESLELAKVAQYLHLVGGRKRLHRELHQIFDSNYDPSPVHQFLADLDAPLLIVTTNYDDLIDRALTRRDRKYELVIHTTNPTLSCRVLWRRHDMSAPDDISPNRLQLDLGNLTIVYKMHGAVDRQDPERDQYVITEDDYVDFLTRMTRNRAVPAMIQDAFRLRSFLFLGYGLHDWNLRVVLNRIEEKRWPGDLKSWAIQDKPTPLEQHIWQERGVHVFSMSIDEFVHRLAAS